MGFGETIKNNFAHYADFTGRAQRSQYWWWMLFVWLATIVLNFVDAALGWRVGASETDIEIGGQVVPLVSAGYGVLTTVFTLLVLLPTLAVLARRLHDTGRSGWWILWIFLLNFVCLIGVIFWLVFTLSRGNAGPNRYGPDPLNQGA